MSRLVTWQTSELTLISKPLSLWYHFKWKEDNRWVKQFKQRYDFQKSCIRNWKSKQEKKEWHLMLLSWWHYGELNNQEVRKTKYINITRFVAIAFFTLEALLKIYAYRKLKKEDPYSEMKKQLLLQKVMIDILAVAVILERTSIYIYI